MIFLVHLGTVTMVLYLFVVHFISLSINYTNIELYQLYFLPLSNIITWTYKVRNNDWSINIESRRDTNMFDDRCLNYKYL